LFISLDVLALLYVLPHTKSGKRKPRVKEATL